MRRGTTATHKIRTSVDLSNATVYVTYKQDGMTILEVTNDGITINKSVATIKLTQEDTLAFRANSIVSVQLRYVDKNGAAGASNTVTLQVSDILKDGEISYIEPAPEPTPDPDPDEVNGDDDGEDNTTGTETTGGNNNGSGDSSNNNDTGNGTESTSEGTGGSSDGENSGESGSGRNGGEGTEGDESTNTGE